MIGILWIVMKDGLTNEKEKELGADPRNPDTDGDGGSRWY